MLYLKTAPYTIDPKSADITKDLQKVVSWFLDADDNEDFPRSDY